MINVVTPTKEEWEEWSANNNTEPNNNPVHEAVQFYWGERCPEHEDGCPTCVAWKQYDLMFQGGVK
jgi:hypothetical protein